MKMYRLISLLLVLCQAAVDTSADISLGTPVSAHPAGAQKTVPRVTVPRVVALEVTSYQAPYDLEQIISARAANYSNIKFVVWGGNFQRLARAQDQIGRSGRYDQSQPQTPRVGRMTPPSEVWFLSFALWDSRRAKSYGSYDNNSYWNYWNWNGGYSSQTYTAVCEISLSPSRITSGEYQGGVTLRGVAKSTERGFWLRSRRLPDVRYEDYKVDCEMVQREALSRAIGKVLDWVARQDPVDHPATRRLAARQARERPAKTARTPNQLGRGRFRPYPGSIIKLGDILVARVRKTRKEIGKVRIVKLGDLAEYEIISLVRGRSSIPQDPSVCYSRP